MYGSHSFLCLTGTFVVLCLSAIADRVRADVPPFISLPPLNDNEAAVQVSGYIAPYNMLAETVMTIVHVKTTSPVNIVYCDSHGDVSIDKSTQFIGKSHGASIFNVTLSATPAVLNTVLGSAGLRCTVYVNNQLRHFDLVYDNDESGKGGARLLKEPKAHTYTHMVENMYKDAPHLLWVVVFVMIIALLVVILIPIIMATKNRKKNY